MPQRARGPRQPITIRLPIDEYREVAIRADKRGWSLSDYIGWCVGREIKSRSASGRVTEPDSRHVDRVFRDEAKGEYGDGRSARWRALGVSPSPPKNGRGSASTRFKKGHPPNQHDPRSEAHSE